MWGWEAEGSKSATAVADAASQGWLPELSGEACFCVPHPVAKAAAELGGGLEGGKGLARLGDDEDDGVALREGREGQRALGVAGREVDAVAADELVTAHRLGWARTKSRETRDERSKWGGIGGVS